MKGGAIMDLTAQQKEAENLIIEWFKTWKEKKKQIFVLSGYAGTGKTFLINHVMSMLDIKDTQVAFGTPTGKAAAVLIQRGRDAATVHRLIYIPEEVEEAVTVAGNSVMKKKIMFKKKETIPEYRLIVLDEVSMIDEKMLEDLLSFGIPVLATGDPGQLPPINGKNPVMSSPDYFLTDIVRQSEGDPIVMLATMARSGKKIPYGNYGSALVLDRRRLSPEKVKDLMLKADQIICGTNATRRTLNDDFRRFKGIDIVANKYPTPGEKVICTVNNWEKYLDEDEMFNLVNGTMGNVTQCRIIDNILNLGKMRIKPDFLEDAETEEIIFDSGIFLNDEWTYDMHQRVFTMPNGKYELARFGIRKNENESDDAFRSRRLEYILMERNAEEDDQINKIEFGYALTVHKFQGSEADRILLFDESYLFGEDANKFLYTAITRAKKKLVIIR
jgi:exodeoxyribonuclease V